MACLHRRHNGFFYIITTEDGKRVWLSLRTRDESEAKRAFQEIECEQQRNTCLKVSLFSSDFMKTASLHLSGKTISMYAHAFKNFIRICGDRPIRKITPLHIEAFKQKRVQEVAPVSVNIEIRSLKAAFAEAHRLKLIGENPFIGTKQVRVPYKEGKSMSESELALLLSGIRDSDFKDLIRLAVFTMMRLGEIVNLRWSDVDLQRMEIRVRSNENFRVKGGKSRTVPMNNWVQRFLLAKTNREGYVFRGRKGQRLLCGSVSRKFKKCIRKCELDERIHFHSLRHTGVSLLINAGVAPQFVQQIAGHGSLSVTETYTHYDDKNLRAAVNAFSAIPTN
jgi:integrase